MEIITELKAVLNNSDEPLSKRLKIAQNALHSVELIGINKEELLLDWFSKISVKSDSKEIWEGLNLCLNSQHFHNFRQSEINQDILYKLIKSISKSLKENKENDVKKSILECAKVILRNTAFKQFFKHDLSLFCTFLSTIITNVDEVEELNNILNDKSILDPKIFVKIDCFKIFLSNVLPTLFDVALKNNDETITNNVIKLLQKVVLQNNIKSFESYIDKIFENETTDSEEIPSYFINEISRFYNYSLNKAQISFKIIVNAFFESYKTQNLFLYKFLVLILQLIGIENDFSDIKVPNNDIILENKKSLTILSDIFEIISVKSKFSDIKLKDISFDDFVKNILNLILKSSKSDENVLNILKSSIILNPLIIDKLIIEIIKNVMLTKKSENTMISYGNLIVSVFEMYLKLHRVHKFTSEILRTFKNTLNEEVSKICGEVDEILPANVLNYYENCITQQSGKQIISIMRTFIVHLQEIVDNLQDYSSNNEKKLYVRTLTEMFCHFLNVVRIPEYSTTQLTVSKFCKDLEEMKIILGKFGSGLLNIEHDQPLMYCFLSLSEAWGDLIIILKYYSTGPNGSQLKDTSLISDLGDYITCNLTYIHGFLSAKQWSVVAQRIKNFGEKPCQNIMHKLQFQKVRAFITLDSQKTDIDQTATLKDALLNLNDNWDILLAENSPAILLLHEDIDILSKMADYIVNEYIQNRKVYLLKQQSILSNTNLIIAILYSWFTKVNGLFKIKRKHNDPLTNKALVTKIFKCFDVNMMVDSDNLSMVFEELSKSFEDISEINVKIDEEKLIKLLKMVKCLPVWGLPGNVQKLLFVFILALRVDMVKNKFDNDHCISTCDNYLKGIIGGPWAPNFITVIPTKLLIRVFVDNIENYGDILTTLLNKSMKYSESIKYLPKIEDLTQYDSNLFLEIATKTLYALNKINKRDMSEESKEYHKSYKEEICNELSQKLLTDENINNTKIEAYVLLLPYYLQQENSENLQKLISVHEKYVEYCTTDDDANQETSLLLFEILLRNRTKITVGPDFVAKSWILCVKIKDINESCFKQLSKTVSLVFEYNSVEEFTQILNSLFSLTVVPLENDNFQDFNNYLKIWHCLISSALSAVKQEVFFKLLVKLFQNIIVCLIKNNDEHFDEVIVKLELDTINNKQIIPTGNMVDIYFETVSIIMSRNYDFAKKYNLSLSIMMSLMETRKYFLIDRLPSYLANVRTILKALCVISHSREDGNDYDKNISDYAFQFEKLIRKITYLKRDMSRIVPYLIADILKTYEKTVFIHGVKNYLDSCIFLLLEICDHYAISYLFRVLSPASTELFKNIYDNYHKFHKFSGRI